MIREEKGMLEGGGVGGEWEEEQGEGVEEQEEGVEEQEGEGAGRKRSGRARRRGGGRGTARATSCVILKQTCTPSNAWSTPLQRPQHQMRSGHTLGFTF